MSRGYEYKAGQVIFRQGYPSDTAYVIQSGKVEIYHELPDGSEKPIVVLGPGQMFGEYGVLDDAPRSASARAMEDTVLMTVDIG
jgi:CRP-like cAMP-binding protein